MSLIKKQSAGIWSSCITLLLAVISCVIYVVNVNGSGYFNGASVPNAIRFAIIAIVILVVVLIVAQFEFRGVLEKVITIVMDGFRIVVPPLFIATAILLVSSRVQGFAFIYFSNEEVLQEVQTSANISSAHGAIATIIAFAVTAILGMIAVFFQLKKKK